jgi:hypothetical protein
MCMVQAFGRLVIRGCVLGGAFAKLGESAQKTLAIPQSKPELLQVIPRKLAQQIRGYTVFLKCLNVAAASDALQPIFQIDHLGLAFPILINILKAGLTFGNSCETCPTFLIDGTGRHIGPPCIRQYPASVFVAVTIRRRFTVSFPLVGYGACAARMGRSRGRYRPRLGHGAPSCNITTRKSVAWCRKRSRKASIPARKGAI